MKKFWKWKNQAATETMPAERTLHLSGTIAEESWFDDDVTPQLFREELMSGSGDITVWINSPGGDCVAAAQIYNMLMDYPGNVTVKIDGIAASAASVIAMAGTTVLMSPVSMMMIHNPMTGAFGDSAEMQKAIHWKSYQRKPQSCSASSRYTSTAQAVPRSPQRWIARAYRAGSAKDGVRRPYWKCWQMRNTWATPSWERALPSTVVSSTT